MSRQPKFARRTDWNLAHNRFSAAIDRARQQGRELLDLSESNPTRCGIEYEPDAILRALAHPQSLTYAPEPKGMLSARQAVAAYYAQRGCAIDPGNILLAAGTSEAYSWIFRLLCEAGDEVLVPAPSYPLFEFLAGIQDVTLRQYPLFYDHGWHLDLHALSAATGERTRAVMVVHPNNPTGSFVKQGELAALNEMCARRGLALVADEVFLDYVQPGQTTFSFAGNSDALTFTLSGLSKISALPQMKVAWLLVSGPDRLVCEALRRLDVIADTYLSVSTPAQLALPALLGQRHDIQRRLAQRISADLAELDSQLHSRSGVQRLQIEGGWYAVLRVPVTATDEELAIRLLEEESVLVHPGHFYDFPQDGYLVVSLITPPQVFAEGMRRILQMTSSS